jgi:hypothetical protein
MDCNDSTCIQLQTCKWDMPVSKSYCSAMWYQEPEKEPVKPVHSYNNVTEMQDAIEELFKETTELKAQLRQITSTSDTRGTKGTRGRRYNYGSD